jgi:hypothetical protein
VETTRTLVKTRGPGSCCCCVIALIFQHLHFVFEASRPYKKQDKYRFPSICFPRVLAHYHSIRDVRSSQSKRRYASLQKFSVPPCSVRPSAYNLANVLASQLSKLFRSTVPERPKGPTCRHLEVSSNYRSLDRHLMDKKGK